MRGATFLWALTLAFALTSWQPAGAIAVTLVQDSSLTGKTSMTSATSPVPSAGVLENLAKNLGVSAGGSAYVNEVVPLLGGEMAATFDSGSPPLYNTELGAPTGFAPWEAINNSVPLNLPGNPPALRLVAQGPTSSEITGNQNTLLWSDDYTDDGLPGQQFFLGGVLDGSTGGALSMLFELEQYAFGFNVIQLDPNQPKARFIWINFYTEAGSLLDLLTIKVPQFCIPPDTCTTGVAIISIKSTEPFYGITLTTNDPAGIGTGDFRFVVPTPLPATLLLLAGGLGVLVIARKRTVVVLA